MKILAFPLILGAFAACAAPRSTSSAPPALPVIADDWPRALKEARARNVPIFVDAWAPW